MTPPHRRMALTIAALACAGMTISGCGALGQAVDCNSAANEVTTIMNDFTAATAASAATDPKAVETAADDAAGKVKTLAADYDGEIGAALNDLAAALDGVKIDGTDPAGSMESVTKLQGFVTKLQQACG